MTRMTIRLPDGVLGMADRDAEWAAWVDLLPRRVAGLLDEWELGVDGLLMHGFTALVVPVLRADGGRAVVKLRFPGDDESEFEHLALRQWNGNGAVRLIRADPARAAMLLERIGPDDLNVLGDLEACEEIARIYARIHVPAFPQLRTVTSYVDRWLDQLTAVAQRAPIPRRYVEQTLHLGRALTSDPDSTGTLIHGDLHFDNVLAGPDEQQPWLVIDPKPMSGDPHYEPAPALWNRWDESVRSGDVRGATRRRFHTLVDAAGLDEARARDWVVVRMVLNASWTVEDAVREGRDLDAEERDWITQCIAITKAVQD
jgi:streptomycin 6-kinase